MGKRLQTVEDHVTDITISTATVDIQVMRIGTKQMTLAVFRQLPTLNIFDQSGTLLAEPWGWVNYDWGYGGGKPFVFSRDGILYRCDVHIDAYQGARVRRSYDPASYHLWAQVDKDDRIITGARHFPSEAVAVLNLENKLKAIAVLNAAPQLFIGV